MPTTAAPLLAHNWNGTNFTYHFTGGLCRLETTEIRIYAYAIFLTVLALVATIENTIVLLVMYKNPVLRQPSILILGILALLDLITASVVTPIKVWLTISESHWGSEAFAHHQKVVFSFIWMFFGVVFFSLSTVLMISIDRFLHVFLLQKYVLTIKRLLLGLLYSYSIPLFITVSVAMRLYTIFLDYLSLAYFLFCILGMVVAYIGMVIMLKRHRSTITDTTELNFRKCIKDERRSVNTTLIIMCTCLAMNLLPIVFIAVWVAGYFSKALCAITFFAMLGNSAVNPIIYCSRVPVIRRHVLELLGIRSLQNDQDESNDYLTVVAEGEHCNIYTSPRNQAQHEDA